MIIRIITNNDDSDFFGGAEDVAVSAPVGATLACKVGVATTGTVAVGVCVMLTVGAGKRVTVGVAEGGEIVAARVGASTLVIMGGPVTTISAFSDETTLYSLLISS